VKNSNKTEKQWQIVGKIIIVIKNGLHTSVSLIIIRVIVFIFQILFLDLINAQDKPESQIS